VVGDLEHIERSLVARDAHRQQPGIDVVLDIAGEQHPSFAEAEVQHDRGVVDPAAVGRRRGRDLPTDGPADLRTDAVEGQAVTRSEAARGDAHAGKSLAERCIAGSGAQHPVLGDARDPVSSQQHRQPGHMVLVRVCEDHEVDAPVPRGYMPVEHGQQPVGVRTPVEQQAPTSRALDEDGVALAHIERRDDESRVPLDDPHEQPAADHDHDQRHGRGGQDLPSAA
jgi:hypothetical protein